MNPLLDQALVGSLILAALAFFAFRTFGRGRKGCSSGCGCSAQKPGAKAPGQ